jgi:methionine synthase I (cobalamin-dependent)
MARTFVERLKAGEVLVADGATATNYQQIQEFGALNAGIPLWIKPNAGLPSMVGDIARYDTSPAEMAEYATHFLDAGAQVIGGCCGSAPAHVAAIAARKRQRNSSLAPLS